MIFRLVFCGSHFICCWFLVGSYADDRVRWGFCGSYFVEYFYASFGSCVDNRVRFCCWFLVGSYADNRVRWAISGQLRMSSHQALTNFIIRSKHSGKIIKFLLDTAFLPVFSFRFKFEICPLPTRLWPILFFVYALCGVF